MRDWWQAAMLGGLMVGLAAGVAAAEPLFASPPHFLMLGDRQQVIFFINEPVAGALASRVGTRAIEVFVPHALVDPTLQGASFRGDEWSGSTVTNVVLATGTRGNARIRIETSRPVGEIHAYSVGDPPRLMIDLLTPAPAPAATPTPRRSVAPRQRAAKSGARTAAAARAAGMRPGPVPSAHVASAPGAAAPRAPALAPVPIETAPAAPPDRAVLALPAMVAVATAPRSQQEGGGARTEHQDGAGRGESLAAAGAGAPPPWPCRWLRVSGVAFCAPDPAAVPYAADQALAGVATALAAGAPRPPAPPAGNGPAPLYLAADCEFVMRAPSRRLLPVIDIYRRALRRFPAFFDAPRARLNIALAYRAMGFAAELRGAAAAAVHDPGAPLAQALVGDLALEQGATERAREAYERAGAGGGVGACLAARGRAALATDALSAASALSVLANLCPASLLADPDTDRLRGRARLGAGDAAGAFAILSGVRDALGPAAEAGLLGEMAAAAEAAGDREAARRIYEEITRGSYGARASGLATVGLARLDAAAGTIATGLQRLAGLGVGQAEGARRAFVLQAVTEALHRGADQDAVVLMHEHGIPPAALVADDQIRLARSYRGVGLVAEAEHLLAQLQRALGATVPDALREERAAGALARGDASATLVVADEWLRVRGVAAPPAARLWRARALAALGETTAALALAEPALGALDAATARDLRVEFAELVRARDPVAAGRLARAALATERLPELPPARAAAALRMLADGAAAAGDDATALEAFSRLAARYGDQPGASGAAYHVARLTAGARGGPGAVAAYGEVTRSADPVERRLATASLAYEVIVRPFEGLQAEP